jgi:hypothetical protein
MLEILNHVLKRPTADMNGTREGMIERHDHEKTHEHEHRQDAGHHHLSRQILGAEKERESHGEHGAANQDRP